ncbi:hypothetical protein NLG97_g4889 [Lecanicillium saksenae]|uniref:Uncharacterized protein n=1 Tax=Lecanicillium saksenae TaxID=468837 RepID=A0ACC1QU05_9HYPO|nr:hypothetical protein NLG97_g4889 [Lecanicillium saksenae]
MLPLYQLLIAAGALLPRGLITATASVIVTGVKVDPRAPSLPPRRSIVDLYSTGGPQWDLYIQALQAMQNANTTDAESYFQVSGIHGKPYIEYDKTGPKSTEGWAGYCPHGQILVKHAKQIAVTYPEEHRARYIAAADVLRMPFWDWAADEAVPQPTVPLSLNINVTENGKLEAKDVENPLHTFKFPQHVLDGEFGEFDTMRRAQIYRCNQPNMSYPETANQLIKRRKYKTSLYDAFTRSSDFKQFATLASSGSSLEGIHGGIHWDGACQSQFLSLDFTGFDPLFMLHHANVDRLWAYWEAMHPDQGLFSGEYLSKGLWSTPINTTITTKSPLQPFRRSETEFHTPESVQSIHDLGYSYPGLEHRVKNPDKTREEVTRIINGLEPTFAKLDGRQTNRQPDRPRTMLTRYFAHMTVELSEVVRPCSIEVSMNGTYAGNLVLMSMPESGVVHGEIPLDSVYTYLRDKNNSAILDSLQAWLQVEIIKSDGSTVPVLDIPSLKMQIEQVHVAAPRSDIELPEYSGSRIFGIKFAEHWILGFYRDHFDDVLGMDQSYATKMRIGAGASDGPTVGLGGAVTILITGAASAVAWVADAWHHRLGMRTPCAGLAVLVINDSAHDTTGFK